MIRTMPYNAIDFSSDLNRNSKYFDVLLQRNRNIIATTSNGDNCFISFEYVPDVMPGTPPTAVLSGTFEDGTGFVKPTAERVVILSNSIIYFFSVGIDVPKSGVWSFVVFLSGTDERLYSEQCRMYLDSELSDNEIVEVIGYNDDETHGYLDSTYRACGFFVASKLNSKIFGNEKVEYSGSYGEKQVLSSENYIKQRFTFHNLSIYQQNLLKWLCNCENLIIDNAVYQIVSDFTEKNNDENNEICDLQADFIEISENFSIQGATEKPSSLEISNLFM